MWQEAAPAPISDYGEPVVQTSFWEKYGGKVIGLVIVSLMAWGAYLGISRFIYSSTAAIDQANQGFETHFNRELQAKEAKETHKDLKEKLAENANEAQALLEKGLSAFRKGDHALAATALKELVDKFPKRPEAAQGLLYRGRSLALAANLGDALTLYNQFIEGHAGHTDYQQGLEWRGELHQAMGNHTSAIADFTSVIIQNAQPEIVTEAYLGRAAAQGASGNKDAALTDYRAVLGRLTASDPRHAKAKEAMAALLKH
jgi:tetratricopeptide (TPR) repeat protein